MTQESIFFDEELVPLIHAAWIDADAHLPTYKKRNMCMYCSNCKHWAGQNKYKTYRYCPWCGAKMDMTIKQETGYPKNDLIHVYTFVGVRKRGDG